MPAAIAGIVNSWPNVLTLNVVVALIGSPRIVGANFQRLTRCKHQCTLAKRKWAWIAPVVASPIVDQVTESMNHPFTIYPNMAVPG